MPQVALTSSAGRGSSPRQRRRDRTTSRSYASQVVQPARPIGAASTKSAQISPPSGAFPATRARCLMNGAVGLIALAPVLAVAELPVQAGGEHRPVARLANCCTRAKASAATPQPGRSGRCRRRMRLRSSTMHQRRTLHHAVGVEHHHGGYRPQRRRVDVATLARAHAATAIEDAVEAVDVARPLGWLPPRTIVASAVVSLSTKVEALGSADMATTPRSLKPARARSTRPLRSASRSRSVGTRPRLRRRPRRG